MWRRFRKMMRLPFFGEGFFDDIDRLTEEMLRDASQRAPKELVRERKAPDGSTIREIGPIVYGYSMKVGPDGRPVVREFGNLKAPQTRGLRAGIPRIELADSREPLVDVIDQGDSVKVVAELPGVDKSEIKLNCDGKTVTLSVDTAERRYYKQEPLGSDVDPDTARATYKNGVLEVTLSKARPTVRGRALPIE
jgi:HSP20 family protein